VIAFLTHVEEVCGDDARFLHKGLTSSDLLDTTLAIQLRAASDLLLADVGRVLAALETGRSSTSSRPASAAATASTPSPRPSG
jgi:adenylosuccinate lyase